MHNDPEGRKMWKALHDQWQETQQRAVELRAQITTKQIACAGGRGADPTTAELEELDRLERLATRMSVEMDNFVSIRLG